jgi:Coenzyme PQQ synthesis protein D (PqqD)
VSAPFVWPGDVAVRSAHDARGPGDDPRVYVAHLPSGPLVVLDGSAAVVWDAATTGGSEPTTASSQDLVVERVAVAAGVETDDVREDVLRLLADLVRRGLLAPAGTTRPHR